MKGTGLNSSVSFSDVYPASSEGYSASSRQEKPNKNNTKRFPCPICLRMFTRPSHVERHMRSHTGEKPFVCPICERGFIDKWTLKQHVGLVHHQSLNTLMS